MKLTQQPQLGVVQNPVSVTGLQGLIQAVWQQIARVVNGSLTFGNPSAGPDNIKGAWYDSTTPAGANTAFTVTHNLGYVPQGWIVLYQDKAASIYDGGVTWTETTISLKCNTSSVHVRLFVIG
jgi:hypothetical protein